MPPDDDIDIAFRDSAKPYDPSQWVVRIAHSYVRRDVRSERRPEVVPEDATIDDEEILIEGRTADTVDREGDRSD
jgi:hypothetical protein